MSKNINSVSIFGQPAWGRRPTCRFFERFPLSIADPMKSHRLYGGIGQREICRQIGTVTNVTFRPPFVLQFTER